MIKKSVIFFIVCTVLICAYANAQDTTIHSLLKKIAAQQISNDDFFSDGNFPSYISPRQKFSTRKKDDNIFFTSLIIYTLKDVQPLLAKEDQAIADSIIIRAKPLYKKFENRSGRNTYNFWRTDIKQEFPYGRFLQLLHKDLALPDDMDDTVLALLALNADSADAAELHNLMQHFVNSDSTKVRSVIDEYENQPAYSTWFGKRFPVVFDVSVLGNVLSFVQHYRLAFTKADSASLNIIIQTIENGYHISQPIYASPYYGKTSLILYHIARLMSISKIPELKAMKPKLISDAVTAFQQSDNPLEKIILSSAIIKWGSVPPSISLQGNDIKEKIHHNNFPFFIGNIPSYQPDFIRKLLTASDIEVFYHYCPAYNDALLLEYLLLDKKLKNDLEY